MGRTKRREKLSAKSFASIWMILMLTRGFSMKAALRGTLGQDAGGPKKERRYAYPMKAHTYE